MSPIDWSFISTGIDLDICADRSARVRRSRTCSPLARAGATSSRAAVGPSPEGLSSESASIARNSCEHRRSARKLGDASRLVGWPAYPRTFLPLLAFPPHGCDVVGRLSRLTPLRPRLHQRPALLQSIGPPISLLRLISDDMCECSFGELAREVCLVARPIAEARLSEAVHRHSNIGARRGSIRRRTISESGLPRPPGQGKI